MKIEQVRENLYCVRKQEHGKRYKVYFNHKPTQKEAMMAIVAKMETGDILAHGSPGSVEDAAKDYIAHHAELSPTTLTAYKSIVKNTPAWFLALNAFTVAGENLQKVVSQYAANHSPKSTKNLNGFYSALFAEIRPDFKPGIKLPKIEKSKGYEPKTDDIRHILEYEDTSDRYGLVFRLLALGLRRGEACALTSGDVDADNLLTINKTLIYVDGKHIIKNCPKTDASNRRILIPADTADRLRTQGSAYIGTMSNINKELHRAQKALNIPSFRLHILRHFSAAFMLRQGFSAVEIEDYMGWEHGSTTMQKIYAYSLDPHESQKDIADAFGKL